MQCHMSSEKKSLVGKGDSKFKIPEAEERTQRITGHRGHSKQPLQAALRVWQEKVWSNFTKTD